MSRMLLVVSTLFEAAPIAAAWGAVPPSFPVKTGWPLMQLGPEIRLVISGVGKANAAAATAWAMRPGTVCIVNLGICGALPGSPAQIGETVLGTSAVFGDEGVPISDGGFRSCAELGFPLFAAAGSDGVQIPERVARALGGLNARRGGIATVSECSGTDERAAMMVRRTGAIAEGMEGAAVALVAEKFGAAWCEARIVSNTTGERGKQVWDAKGAAGKLGTLARTVVSLLESEFITGPSGSTRPTG